MTESGQRNQEPAAGLPFGVASDNAAINMAWPSATEVNISSTFEKLGPDCCGGVAEAAEEADSEGSCVGAGETFWTHAAIPAEWRAGTA